MAGRRRRAIAVAEAADADTLVVAHPSVLTWLTGYAPEIESGPSPFALPPIAVLGSEGAPVLVVSDDEAEAAAATGCEVAAYAGFGIGPLDPLGRATRALSDVLSSSRVAIDAGILPAGLAEGLDWVDVGADLAKARAVKDPDEVELIRAVIAVCDEGQAATRAHAEAGITELELWAAVRGAMETAAGTRLPVLADLVAGPRTAEIGGPPSSRVIEDGDLVLCDLVPRLAGYWGDSCATFAVGEPSDEAKEAHAQARETLADLVATIRPGLVAGELDVLARARLEFPHHTGHGIGTGYHEEPRLIPGSATVLEAGMVIAMEPGTYSGAGVRVEQVVLVTTDGCEVLSGHELGL
jgi:Xaa-Pro aminopeptidase